MTIMKPMIVKVSVLLLGFAGCGAAAFAAPASPQLPKPAIHPARSSSSLPATLRPALYGALAEDAGPVYRIDKKGCATLPKQELKACFDGQGAHFTGAAPLSLHLVAYGRSANGRADNTKLTIVKPVRPGINGNEASYRHGALTEWWRVLPMGFEQGFTIAKPPGGKGELVLVLAASQQGAGAPVTRHSRLPVRDTQTGEGGNPVKKASRPTAGISDSTGFRVSHRSLGMTKKNGNTLAWDKLRYGELVVTDAQGKLVPATLKSEGDRILIAVNDAHATYPLTVDPLVWLEQEVTAADGATNDHFGTSVALASDGTTFLVGMERADVNGHDMQGAVYVFTESGGTWAQTQKLTAADGAAGDSFGWSVALASDGTTALVGAFGKNGSQGAAYVFSESGGTWAQTQELTAADGAADDQFGVSVALGSAGTTALVGANGKNGSQGAAYVFSESGGTWTQTQELTASNGAASDYFGISVALGSAGTTALVGAAGRKFFQGAAYVFSESGGTWAQTQELTASDGVGGDFFGRSVALGSAGTTALVAAVNKNSFQGAAYVFNESGGTWAQTQELTASDGAAGDNFGISVALGSAGTTALVGAEGKNSFQGAAYVFNESGGTWAQTQELTVATGVGDDYFGRSVALGSAGTTALVGALRLNNSQGTVYFEAQSDLGLTLSAPQTVGQDQQYVSQTIATNNSSAATPAVSATIAVPAAASFVSATATQGSCSEDSGVVSCDFGQINGNAGTATANVTLKATGNVGDTIDNTASVAHASPPLSAGAPTTITEGGACPDGYTEYDGTLNPGEVARSPAYQAPGGSENAILTAPERFQLYAVYQSGRFGRHVYLVPGNEVHRWGPKGLYMWLVRARDNAGAYTLCLQHP